MQRKRLTGLAVAALAMTTGVGLGLAAPASAHGTGNAKAHGDCSVSSTWYIKADGNRGGEGHTVEVKFRINTSEGGQAWDWQITDNGTVAATGSTTSNSNGLVKSKQSIPNLEGPDTIVLDATNSVTGETCHGEVTLKGSH